MVGVPSSFNLKITIYTIKNNPQYKKIYHFWLFNMNECNILYIYDTLDILIGLLRLRKCSKDSFRSELRENASVVRELHVYPKFHVVMFIFFM